MIQVNWEGLYRLNQDVTSKSNVAKWVFENNYNGWINCLPLALELRKNPLLANLPKNKAWLSSLGSTAQKSCDDLEILIKEIV